MPDISQGDLILVEGKSGVVTSIEGQVMTYLTDTETDKLSVTDPKVTYVASPRISWPLVTVPTRPTGKGITKLSFQEPDGTTDLVRFQDWCLSDPFRCGGSIYLSPALELKPGHSITVRYGDGHVVSVKITRQFLTIAQKKAILVEKAKPPINVFEKLMEDF